MHCDVSQKTRASAIETHMMNAYMYMYMKTKGEEGPLSKIDKSIKSSLKVVVNYFAMGISIE